MSAIVLAGGQSRRLGQDKCLLTLAGQPLLVRIVDRLRTISDDVIVVTNEAGRYASLGLPVRLVADEQPGFGSLMGIYSGVKIARHPLACAVACDMPFLNLPLLRYMLDLAPGYAVVVPRLDDFFEPLHAVYARSSLPAMERVLAGGRRRIVAFYDDVRTRYVVPDEIERFDPQHLAFLNVNTAEDWARVQEIAGQEIGRRGGPAASL